MAPPQNASVIENVYDEVRACVAALRSAGFADSADVVSGCLYGSTSGEILTDLGATLHSMLRSNQALPDPLRGRLAALLQDVGRRLRAVGQVPPAESDRPITESGDK
jgi:hypothetical protein